MYGAFQHAHSVEVSAAERREARLERLLGLVQILLVAGWLCWTKPMRAFFACLRGFWTACVRRRRVFGKGNAEGEAKVQGSAH